MNTNSYAVALNGLVKRRGSFTLGPIDLELPKGLVTGLVGANGSGKTTMLRTLVGLMKADAGSVTIPELAEIGISFDQPCVLPDWTLNQAATAFSYFRPGWNQDWFDQLCSRFRLRSGNKIKDLSRGEANKLMVALALGNRPKLLILDEPTSGLDPASRADIVDLLREYLLDQDASLLFSTHITSDLVNFADYLVFIDSGQILYSGLLDDFVERFAYAQGSLDALTSANASRVIGLRRTRTAFDGIVALEDSAAFGSGVVFDTPTLDQIVVHHQLRSVKEN